MIQFKLNMKNSKFFKIAPTRIIVMSFILLILCGSLLLNLPIASNDGKSIGFLNALFTATSASCVTGLIIADTATQFTLFGQIVIISLIQVGGLGIITLATFFTVLLGKKVGLKRMVLVQESLNHFTFHGILRLLRSIIIFTLCFETIGALLLSVALFPTYGLKSFYMGVFHSISSFCNAGFDLFGDYKSVMEYTDNPIIMYTISSLIIFGGLGFIVWKDLFDYKKKKSLLLHTKIVLVISASLIIFGTIFFFVFEYNNPKTMEYLNTYEKFNASLFHSVSCRTAGYSSVPIEHLSEISKAITVILMFIGAAPGSTAGGVKVTTFGVVLMAILCQVRGKKNTTIFNRRIPYDTIIKALTIMGLSAILVITVTTMILAVDSSKHFIDILLEVTSAFGTVGLSSLGTFTLSSISKVLLIITMILGRVGPLTFAIALAMKNTKTRTQIVYPEGKIMVG